MSHIPIGAALDCDESDIRCQLSQTAQGFDWLGIRKDGKRFLTTRQEEVDASQKLDNFFKIHIDHITLILVDRNRSGSPRAKLPDHTHSDISRHRRNVCRCLMPRTPRAGLWTEVLPMPGRFAKDEVPRTVFLV